MSAKIIFVIGGARSGKSSFALSEAEKAAGTKAYIATAQAFDQEMHDRIQRHRKERSTEWTTYEEPVRITETLKEMGGNYDVIVLDCLTLWLSNLLCTEEDCDRKIDNFIHEIHNSKLLTHNSKLFLVSNEVGMGIVPENELARKFRDLAGTLNQKIAAAADEVYTLIAGIPVRIKGEKI